MIRAVKFKDGLLKVSGISDDTLDNPISFFKVLFAGVVFLVVLGLKIHLETKVTSLGYEIADLQEKNIALIKKIHDMKLKQSVLERPDILRRRLQALKIDNLRSITPSQLVLIRYEE